MPHFRPLMLLANRLSSIQSILAFERWEGYHHFEDEKVSHHFLCPLMQYYFVSLTLTLCPLYFVSIISPGYWSSCNTCHLSGHTSRCQYCPISPIQAYTNGSDYHSTSRNYFFDDNTVSTAFFLVNRFQCTSNGFTVDGVFYISVSISPGRILLDLHFQPVGDHIGLIHDQSVESVYSCSFGE